MAYHLFDIVEYEGPTEFSRADLESEEDLFAQRAALFYTPTSEIPEFWIGSGPLQHDIPVAMPSYFEFAELQGYRTPRLWVDLLQRATWKIRWTPITKFRLKLVRYDVSEYPFHAIGGAKALIDALKWRTTGRSDGRLLYYFGAVEDDTPRHLIDFEFLQEPVSHPSEAHCRIEIQPA